MNFNLGVKNSTSLHHTPSLRPLPLHTILPLLPLQFGVVTDILVVKMREMSSHIRSYFIQTFTQFYRHHISSTTAPLFILYEFRMPGNGIDGPAVLTGRFRCKTFHIQEGDSSKSSFCVFYDINDLKGEIQLSVNTCCFTSSKGKKPCNTTKYEFPYDYLSTLRVKTVQTGRLLDTFNIILDLQTPGNGLEDREAT